MSILRIGSTAGADLSSAADGAPGVDAETHRSQELQRLPLAAAALELAMVVSMSMRAAPSATAICLQPA